MASEPEQVSSLAKKSIKGILKNSTSFDQHDQCQETTHDDKKMKWDEMNILATYHPSDKDYGHMKIDDPPTPYHRESEAELLDLDLDPESLASRLTSEGNSKIAGSEDQSFSESGDEVEDESTEHRERRASFEQKRKIHYNEFQAIKLARKLLEEEDDNDEDGDDADDDDENSSKHKTEIESSSKNTDDI